MAEGKSLLEYVRRQAELNQQDDKKQQALQEAHAHAHNHPNKKKLSTAWHALKAMCVLSRLW